MTPPTPIAGPAHSIAEPELLAADDDLMREELDRVFGSPDDLVVLSDRVAQLRRLTSPAHPSAGPGVSSRWGQYVTADPDFSGWLAHFQLEAYAQTSATHEARLYQTYLLLNVGHPSFFAPMGDEQIVINEGANISDWQDPDGERGRLSIGLYRGKLDKSGREVLVKLTKLKGDRAVKEAIAYALFSFWGLGPQFYGAQWDEQHQTWAYAIEPIHHPLLVRFDLADVLGGVNDSLVGDAIEEVFGREVKTYVKDRRRASLPINKKTLQDLKRLREFYRLFSVSPNDFQALLDEDGSIHIIDPYGHRFFDDPEAGNQALDHFLYTLWEYGMVPADILPLGEAAQLFTAMVLHDPNPESAIRKARGQGFAFPSWESRFRKEAREDYAGFVRRMEKELAANTGKETSSRSMSPVILVGGDVRPSSVHLVSSVPEPESDNETQVPADLASRRKAAQAGMPGVPVAPATIPAILPLLLRR